MEEWISLNEYARRFKMNVNNVKHLIHIGELQATKTEGGHFKIKVGGNTVPREMYEKEKEERIRLQTILDNITLMIKERK